MKKTVLFLEQQSWRGGAQRVLKAVVDSLADEFRPIVGFPDRGPFCAELEEKGIETFTYPLGHYRTGGKSYREMAIFAMRSLLCGFRLARVVRKRAASIIYINGPRCLPAGVLAAWLTGRPAVFHLHLVLLRRTEIFLVRVLARHVSSIVACSQAAARPVLDAAPRLAGKTRIVYNAVPDLSGGTCGPAETPARTPAGRFTLGMVGRITESKGQHSLLNAVSSLRPDLKDKVRLIIVGAPAPGSRKDLKYAARLQASAIEHGLREKVLWAGHQPDVASYYSSMDALVHPSSSEAIGLVILEALQRGIPIIASRTGGIPEVVREGSNGLLVPAGDETALARALERFLEDGSLRRQLCSGARNGLDDRFAFSTFRPAIRCLVSQLCGSDSTGGTEAGEEEIAAAWK